MVRPLLACLITLTFSGLSSVASSEELPAKLITVTGFAETISVDTQGDAADDPEIWPHPTDRSKSLVFGTDKKRGLMVFDLQGKLVDRHDVGRINNVDLRNDFTFGDTVKTLVGASDRTRKGVTFFTLDPKNGKVTHLAKSFVKLDVEKPYGFCLYKRPSDDQLFAIVTSKKGEVRQLALIGRPDGSVKSTLVRSFEIGSISEGCVVDDKTGRLFIAEENVGIWRYNADPNKGNNRKAILEIDYNRIVADIEGLTIMRGPKGQEDHLIASVQGNNTFAILSLSDEKFLGRFRIHANESANIDAVTETDGVAAAPGSFGSNAPKGLIAVQDDVNDGDAQNFKYVSWADILSSLQ